MPAADDLRAYVGYRRQGRHATRNFVTFPDYQKDILMLERNGRPMSDFNTWGGR